ncbi:MAG: MOSC domain-containing protein [Candidatus Dormiibacterota bacterium]
MQMNDGQGRVEAIFLADAHGGPPHEVSAAAAHPGRGLEGDRHLDDPKACDITLIEAERVEEFRSDYKIEIGPGGHRRQVVVRGIDLGRFIGRRFRVGEIECEGEERCEPCNDLVNATQTPEVLRGLLHSGLRADVLKGGTISIGDAVELSAVTTSREL